PAVLAFVRHFGCLFCFEQVADMVSVAPAIAEACARLCFIGNGNPLHAQVFMEETGLTKDVYTDPARLLYKRLSMKHGVFSTLNRSSRRNARRASSRGFQQVGVRGDAWQQGGVLAVTREGVVAYLQRFSVAGERVDLADIEQAARRLTATG